MATVFSHALVGTAIVALFPKRYRSPKIYALAALTAVLPDFDYIGFAMGVPYDGLWGHRGLTHSLFFALAIALLSAFAIPSPARQNVSGICAALFITTASHTILDACTKGGLGVALYSPFDTGRYFLPWRPIQVSPMGIGFFSGRGLVVLRSELVWLVLPCALIWLARYLAERRNSPKA